MGKIILKCVTEKKKLRIKFFCYINDDGKEYRNVYNNEYNCRFPKDIRLNGRYYEIDETNLNTCLTKGAPFYCVKKNGIKILQNYNIDIDIDKIKIYSIDECVICMSQVPATIFLPCGHQVCCKDCTKALAQHNNNNNNKCPLCRTNIDNTYYITK